MDGGGVSRAGHEPSPAKPTARHPAAKRNLASQPDASQGRAGRMSSGASLEITKRRGRRLTALRRARCIVPHKGRAQATMLCPRRVQASSELGGEVAGAKGRAKELSPNEVVYGAGNKPEHFWPPFAIDGPDADEPSACVYAAQGQSGRIAGGDVRAQTEVRATRRTETDVCARAEGGASPSPTEELEHRAAGSKVLAWEHARSGRGKPLPYGSWSTTRSGGKPTDKGMCVRCAGAKSADLRRVTR